MHQKHIFELVLCSVIMNCQDACHDTETKCWLELITELNQVWKQQNC